MMETRILISAGAGLVVGVGIGVLIANKAAEKKWSAIANEEIEQVKDHYQLFRKEGKYADPRTAFDQFNSILNEMEYDRTQGEPDAEVEESSVKIGEPYRFEDKKDPRPEPYNVFDNEQELAEGSPNEDDPSFWSRDGLEKFVISEE